MPRQIIQIKREGRIERGPRPDEEVRIGVQVVLGLLAGLGVGGFIVYLLAAFL
jgi:hypothetical protein